MMEKEKLKGILSDDWLDKLGPFVESEEFDKITGYIAIRKAAGHRVMPSTDRIFTALNKCPPNAVKVIMGLQDPYNSIEPDGLAMSCSLTGKLQPSLREVYREIARTVPKDNRDVEHLLDPDLSYWAEQGVLLINASLTVEWKDPNCHQGLWDKFIDTVFHDAVNEAPYPLIYIMLGKEALKFSRYARMGDYLLTATHPASVAYSGGVWDCQDVFNRCNRYLEMHDHQPIKW